MGSGSVVLSTYPLEYMASVTPRVNPEATSRLYDAPAAHAGVRRPVTVDDPRVAVDLVVHEQGHRLVWLVSRCPQELRVRPAVEAGRRLTALDGEPVDKVTLEPYGVSVLRLEASNTPWFVRTYS